MEAVDDAGLPELTGEAHGFGSGRSPGAGRRAGQRWDSP